MLNIGHRGAMGYEPENTLLSIEKAIQLGADYVEVDVYFVNGRLIIIHDKTLNRTTNFSGLLSNFTFEELRQADAGKGEKIPTLDEVTKLTKNRVGLNIELKGKQTAKPVQKLLSTLSEPHQKSILVSSFHKSELTILRKLNNTIRLGVLTTKALQKTLKDAIALDAFSIHINKEMVSKVTIEKIHKAGFKVYVYTVNRIDQIQEMQCFGVDGVFSNYPDKVRQVTQ